MMLMMLRRMCPGQRLLLRRLLLIHLRHQQAGRGRERGQAPQPPAQVRRHLSLPYRQGVGTCGVGLLRDQWRRAARARLDPLLLALSLGWSQQRLVEVRRLQAPRHAPPALQQAPRRPHPAVLKALLLPPALPSPTSSAADGN